MMMMVILSVQLLYSEMQHSNNVRVWIILCEQSRYVCSVLFFYYLSTTTLAIQLQLDPVEFNMNKLQFNPVLPCFALFISKKARVEVAVQVE